jgi:hypothetical protein
MENRNYYVFRIDTREKYRGDLRVEIRQGRLRQGWGTKKLDIRQEFSDFSRNWPWLGVDEKGRRSRYNILKIMIEMNPGDIVIVPKCFKDGEFAVLEVTDKYTFDTDDVIFGDEDDFRHVIKIDSKKIIEVPHNASEASLNISRSFRGYQSAINRISRESIARAIDEIIEKKDKHVSSTASVIDLIDIESTKYYDDMLMALKERLNAVSGRSFQNLVKELFIRNGYELVKEEHYNRLGGDFDLVFALPNGDLLSDIIDSSNNLIPPRLNIQAKNKKGNDLRDIVGVDQLIKMNKPDDINLLINITDEFTEECKVLAQNNNVILVNWATFAKLYLQYRK